MKWLMMKALALLLTFTFTLAAPAWADNPTQVVKGVIDEVIRLLSDPALKAPAQKMHRRQLIKQVIDQRFDYGEMARRCLGVTWRQLGPDQRSEFVSLFGQLLEASYSDKIEKYSGETVTYLGEALDNDEFAEVRTVLLRKNDRFPMDYRLLNSDAGWMIYDVVIEGVSLVANYRSQFTRIVQESSYGELVRRLRVKLTELKDLENI
jgi:phospholipid transport system substrate-binding protein